jgi:hypothetical protein
MNALSSERPYKKSFYASRIPLHYGGRSRLELAKRKLMQSLWNLFMLLEINKPNRDVWLDRYVKRRNQSNGSLLVMGKTQINLIGEVYPPVMVLG